MQLFLTPQPIWVLELIQALHFRLGIKVHTYFSLNPIVCKMQILGQNQHPGPILETREQELSFDTKIKGIFHFILGNISFYSFDRSY